jgi:exodeoxyribonuclease VII small subunit
MSTQPQPEDFEACMQRLDAIVRELESGSVPLERAMTLFEEGLRLGGSCRGLLEQAQVRVEKLLASVEASAPADPAKPLD